MESLNVLSLNVRGLREVNKRRQIFDFYRKKCHILCLQETHSVQEDEVVWTSEWGGQVYYSHGTNMARGVAILIQKDFPIKIEKTILDNAGRYIVMLLSTGDNQRICLSNIYAPNKDSPQFFQDIFLKSFELSEKMVIVGDYNTVLNVELDRNQCQNLSNNNKSTEKLRSLMDELKLCEIWRDRNDGIRRYSWYRSIGHKVIQRSRLDYAIISAGLADVVHDTFYLNGLRSDHSAFFVGLLLQSNERGPGYWKFNTTLLSQIDYLKFMNSTLNSLKTSLDGIESVERWELIKEEIKKKTMQYSRQQSKDNMIAISQLSEYITHTEDRLDDADEKTLKNLQNSKIELESLTFKRTQGVMFRSKAKWYMEGERNTKYFYNLEKSRYNAKNCARIYDQNGILHDNQSTVLDLMRSFYDDLYQSDPNVKI